MSVVMAAAMVDLPSLGKHDVRPMTLEDFASLFRSRVSFIDRIASAYGDDGESATVRQILEADRILLEAIRSKMGMGRIALLLDGEPLFLPSGSRGTSARHSVSRTDCT